MKKVASALGLLLLACSACSESHDPTEIVVVVDSDLHAPQEIDRVSVSVRRDRDDAEMQTAEGPVLDEDGVRSLPLTVGVDYTGGDLGPLRIVASALLDGEVVVEREARVSFVDGRRVSLLLTLLRSCQAKECPDADETCVDGSCDGIDVPPSELEDWNSLPDPLDAGAPTGGDAGDAGGDAAVQADACVRSAEECNDLDDDCDGDTDEDFDFNSLQHCGSCNVACPVDVPFGASVCQDGKCALVCAPGTDDCDGMPGTGCEAVLSEASTCGDCQTQCGGGEPLCSESACAAGCGGTTPDQCDDSCVNTDNDPFHCGDCETACPDRNNSQATCSPGGSCGYTCLGTYDDCDSAANNGCESDLQADALHCGDCDTACPVPPHAIATCGGASCGYTCQGDYDDCDSAAANGCESDLQTDLLHCGDCDTACPKPGHATATCGGGSCDYTCDNGYTDCNGSASDGCEVNTNDNNNHCGGCGIKCTGLLMGCCAGTCKLLSLCT